MKRSVVLLITVFIAVVGAFLIFKFVNPNENNNEGKKFHEEYSKVDEDNIFVYKNIAEIINILERGTGIIYLGFPECPWCQEYVVYINEMAKSYNVKEIYYYNIKEARNNNTDNYQKIVSLLSDYLPYDDSLNKRVYVPNITFVKNGKIIANDNETALISDGTTPKDYWTKEKETEFKDKLDKYFKEYTGTCTSCN